MTILRHNHIRVVLFLTLSFFIVLPNSSVKAAEKGEPLQVMVSILPQEYFVKRIGGPRIRVEALVQPGQSPATYAPTPKQMATLATSTIYFRIGVPFENGLIPKLVRSAPDLRVIDLRQGIDTMQMEESHADHDHDHGDLDPHTWLDPMLAMRQSAFIRDTLAAFDPEGAATYNSNYEALSRDLNQLDNQLKQALKPLAGKSIYVFHPAYGYFCRAYGLKQIAIYPEGKNPGARYLARLIEQAKQDQARAIFVQPQFSDKAAQTIANSIKGRVVALDPLARDYLENMQSIAKQLASTFPNHKP